MSFDSFSFDDRITAGINTAGYTTPTPIQQQAMGDVLKGRDVMGLAQTGTGKTAAFVLPILQRLLDADASGKGPVRVLVVAPTRELALQIHETFVTLGGKTGYKSAVVFGGVGANPQIKALKQATICVACPGRLLDLVGQGAADLSAVDVLVLDEADRMLDMGFLPDIRKILALLPAKRQNLLFSATMPKEIEELSRSILDDPAVVQVANTVTPERIGHTFYKVPVHLKNTFLEALLDRLDYQSVLIFTRTKHKARSLGQKLEKKGLGATFLQGNMSQTRRQQALDGFKSGTYRIMVATDIAARGIDCDCISHVINFDMPDTAETYTHRIGRTGRVERAGQAITLVSDKDTLPVSAVEKVLGEKVHMDRLEGFDYSAPRQQPAKQGQAPKPKAQPQQQKAAAQKAKATPKKNQPAKQDEKSAAKTSQPAPQPNEQSAKGNKKPRPKKKAKSTGQEADAKPDGSWIFLPQNAE